MKKTLFFFFALALSLLAPVAIACDVCKRNQPVVLKGTAHGAGPDSQWDYLIIALVAVSVVVTLWLSLKWLIKPGEQSAMHIKRTVLTLSNHE